MLGLLYSLVLRQKQPIYTHIFLPPTFSTPQSLFITQRACIAFHFAAFFSVFVSFQLLLPLLPAAFCFCCLFIQHNQLFFLYFVGECMCLCVTQEKANLAAGWGTFKDNPVSKLSSRDFFLGFCFREIEIQPRREWEYPFLMAVKEIFLGNIFQEIVTT